MTDTAPTPEVLYPLPEGTTVAEYSPTAAALNELALKIAGHTFDCTTTAGDEEARQTRLVLVKLRTSLDAKRKELKAPILAQAALIESEAQRITAAIEAMELPIDALIRQQEAVREAARHERQRKADAKRKAEDAALDALRMLPSTVIGKSAADILAALNELQGRDVATSDDPALNERLTAAAVEALRQLHALHDAAVTAEANAVALAEQERLRQQEREEQAERDRRAEAQRKHDAEQERMLVALRELPLNHLTATSVSAVTEAIKALPSDAELAERFDAEHLQAAIAARDSAADALGAIETAEWEREQVELARKQERKAQAVLDRELAETRAIPGAQINATAAELKAIAAEVRTWVYGMDLNDDHRAHLFVARDEVAAQIDNMAATAKEREEQAEAAACARAQAEAARLANTDLAAAARDAVELLGEMGQAEHIITRTLVAALSRVPGAKKPAKAKKGQARD